MRRPFHPLASVAVALLVSLSACAGAGAPGVTDASDAVRLVLAQQTRFAGIEARDANLIGQASWYEVSGADDGWQVTVRIGWGDCPAGCINEHRWTYAVARNGGVELLREEGDEVPDATGVRGTVTAGPTCPVVTDPPDPACADRPVAGAVLILTGKDGAEVARVTSAADGTFSVELAPGRYTLTAEPVDGLMGTPAPMEIVVEAAGPMTEVPVSYDTGIR